MNCEKNSKQHFQKSVKFSRRSAAWTLFAIEVLIILSVFRYISSLDEYTAKTIDEFFVLGGFLIALISLIASFMSTIQLSSKFNRFINKRKLLQINIARYTGLGSALGSAIFVGGTVALLHGGNNPIISLTTVAFALMAASGLVFVWYADLKSLKGSRWVKAFTYAGFALSAIALTASYVEICQEISDPKSGLALLMPWLESIC